MRDQLGGLSSQQAPRMSDIFFFISVFLPWRALMFLFHQAQLILTNDCTGRMLGPWIAWAEFCVGRRMASSWYCLLRRDMQVLKVGCREESTVRVGWLITLLPASVS